MKARFHGTDKLGIVLTAETSDERLLLHRFVQEVSHASGRMIHLGSYGGGCRSSEGYDSVGICSIERPDDSDRVKWAKEAAVRDAAELRRIASGTDELLEAIGQAVAKYRGDR